MMSAIANKSSVDGVLLLDKPLGMSSAKAVSRVKHLFNAKKAGHTGSLDPLATGLLPICLGQATKFSGYLLDADKTYQAVARLGATTTTADCESEVVTTRPVPTLTTQQLGELADRFTGELTQIPSMYSALKYQGKPLYKLARQGIEIERQARRIQIKSLTITQESHATLHLTVHCSKGTYIRNLVEDMGEALGCGAHVSQLRRIGVGAYQMEDGVDLATLTDCTPAQRLAHLQPIASLCDYPSIELEQSIAQAVLHGQVVTLTESQIVDLGSPTPGILRAFDDDLRFIGLIVLTSDNCLIAKRMICWANEAVSETSN